MSSALAGIRLWKNMGAVGEDMQPWPVGQGRHLRLAKPSQKRRFGDLKSRYDVSMHEQ